jgi:heme/copper-type cytochrome/quinol oxidase subunit 4
MFPMINPIEMNYFLHFFWRENQTISFSALILIILVIVYVN